MTALPKKVVDQETRYATDSHIIGMIFGALTKSRRLYP